MLNEKKITKTKELKLTSILTIFLTINLMLVWTEILYSSLSFYGGLGKHQNLPLGANNLGFLGSLFFCLCILFVLKFRNTFVIKNKLLYSLIILIFFLHYIILALLH